MNMVARLCFTEKDKKKFEEYLAQTGKHYYDLAHDLRLSRAYIGQIFGGITTFGVKRLKEIEKWCGFEFEVEEDETSDLQ